MTPCVVAAAADGDNSDNGNESESRNENGDEMNPLRNGNNHDNDNVENDPEKNITKEEKRFVNVFTMSQIDFLADSCRSKWHLAITYLSFVFAVFWFRRSAPVNVCKSGNFGCTIANSVLFFLLVMGMTM